MKSAYSVRARSRANPDAVFSTLVRAGTWPAWSPIDSVEVDHGDPDSAQGPGDVRSFRTGRVVSRERIVELAEDRRFVYENLSGPFRDYRGTIDLEQLPEGGTAIAWSAHFTPKLPLSGWFWRWYLTRYMQRMADGLAKFAENGGR
jgi:hypothetical protein